MGVIASALKQSFPERSFDLLQQVFVVYAVIWGLGFILQIVVNMRMKTMAKQGIQGLPVTSWMDRSFRTVWEKWGFFLKGKYRSTGDGGFIMLCDIYRGLIVLIILMLGLTALMTIGFPILIMQVRH